MEVEVFLDPGPFRDLIEDMSEVFSYSPPAFYTLLLMDASHMVYDLTSDTEDSTQPARLLLALRNR